MIEFVFSLLLISQNCYSGSITDCLKNAKKYEQEKDYNKAIEYYDAGCILEDGYSCAKLSIIYIEGLWGTTKKIEMKERLKIGSEYSKRAYMIFKDNNERIYQITCEEFNLSGGCLNLAAIYESTGRKDKSEQSLKKAYEIATRKCKGEKSPNDCYILGFMYYNGRFTNEDKNKGIELFERACSMKNGTACFYLYEIYENDPKYNKSPKEYLRKSCEYFDAYGCWKNWEKTGDKKYLYISCELGYSPACSKLKSTP
ncbi:MAG: sel1 repeat family protein [bacterium]|nr:sel1 repeat family protein [bacterium]